MGTLPVEADWLSAVLLHSDHRREVKTIVMGQTNEKLQRNSLWLPRSLYHACKAGGD